MILGDDTTKQPYLDAANRALVQHERLARSDHIPLAEFLSLVSGEYEQFTSNRVRALQTALLGQGPSQGNNVSGMLSFRHFSSLIRRLPGGQALSVSKQLKLFHLGLDRSNSDSEVSMPA